MELKFSQKLIEQAIKVFKEEDSLDISPETANEYLDSLSGLFLVLADREPRAAFIAAEGLASNQGSLTAIELGLDNQLTIHDK